MDRPRSGKQRRDVRRLQTLQSVPAFENAIPFEAADDV
jgi:hypothetical protein